MDFNQILSNLHVGSCPMNAEDIDCLGEHMGIMAVLNLQTVENLAYRWIDWDNKP